MGLSLLAPEFLRDCSAVNRPGNLPIPVSEVCFRPLAVGGLAPREVHQIWRICVMSPTLIRRQSLWERSNPAFASMNFHLIRDSSFPTADGEGALPCRHKKRCCAAPAWSRSGPCATYQIFGNRVVIKDKSKTLFGNSSIVV